MSHHWLQPVAEELQEIVDQTALGRVSRGHGLKDMRMADLLDPPKSVLLLHTVDGGLNGCIRGPIPFRKGFLNLADGAGTLRPEHLHYRELQLGKFWRSHKFRSIWVMLLYEFVFCKPFPGSSARIVNPV